MNRNNPVAATRTGKEPTMAERILRRPEVERLTGLSRSTLYSWMGKDEFPRPVALGARLVGWREGDIQAWLKAREMKGAA
jgi:prophage regulatory protein